MSDRELLELAAKAAGIAPVLCYESARNCLRIGDRNSYKLWRPLTDDGDALRLAVKLRIEIERSQYNEHSVYAGPSGTAKWREESDGERDIYAATRRAIVRAAAEICRAMP